MPLLTESDGPWWLTHLGDTVVLVPCRAYPPRAARAARLLAYKMYWCYR